jgi:hypothetical protein
MTEPAVTIHVERTTNAEVLRWVCHRPDLDRTPLPPPGSALRRMIDDEVIACFAVTSGDLLIGFQQPDDMVDPEELAAVHQAVTDALGDPNWSGGTGTTAVSIRTPRRRAA